MRAAIVGTGFIARVHAIALQSLGVEVAAVAGSARWAGRGVRRGRAVRRSRRAARRASRVDVLHVCTPNDVHAAQALAAIERGVHVVCEKPLAVSTDESRAMVEAAEARGSCTRPATTPAAIRSSSRCGPTWRPASIGEVSFVHGRYLCDDVLFPASGWRIDPARSGPSYVVGDLGTHWLDLAEHVTGRHVTEVLADFRSFAGGPLEDYAALLLRLGDGVAGIARALGRRRRPQEPAPLRVRGHGRRPDVGPGAADRDAPPPGRRARSRSSSRTRPRTPSPRAASPATPPATARATARRSATSSPTSTPRSRASRTPRSRRSATATAASRRSRPPSRAPRDGRLGARRAAACKRCEPYELSVSRVQTRVRPRRAGRPRALPAQRRQGERERDQHQRRERAAASRARSPRA